MKFLISCLLLLVSGLLYASCTEVLIYRFNDWAVERIDYLFYDGQLVAEVHPGVRIQTQVCGEGPHTFDVRPSPHTASRGYQTLKIREEQLFLRIGGGLNGIQQINPTKGQRDWERTHKFTGPIRQIRLPDGSVVVAYPTGGGSDRQRSARVPSSSVSSGATRVGSEFTVHDFHFRIIDIIKAGDILRIEYQVMNLAVEDRQMSLNPANTYFYDEHGELYFARKVCVGNKCGSVHYNTERLTVRDTWNGYNGGAIATNMLPAGIAVLASLEIPNIRSNANQLVRGNIMVAANRDTRGALEILHRNILVPDRYDATDPNRRDYGEQSTKLLKAERATTGLRLYLRHTNQSSVPHTLRVVSAALFDDRSQQYDAETVSYITSDQKVPLTRRGGVEHTLVAGQTVDFFLTVPQFNPQANRLTHVAVSFGDFQLKWADISVEGMRAFSTENTSPRTVKPSTTAAPSTSSTVSATPRGDYLDFQNFNRRVRRGESVGNSRIILDHIHFHIASDKLQTGSYRQLNELARLLNDQPRLRLEISGHTDATGEAIRNKLLSQRRADTIRYYLIGRGIASERMTSVGYGSQQPLGENETEAGRQRNRRVEIRVTE